MPPTDRRRFLAGAALAATAGPLALVRQAAAIEPIGRTRPSHLKLSLAAYSYRKYLDLKAPSMDLFDFVELAADMALDAVEPTSYYVPPDADSGYFHRLRRHAFLHGLDISGTAVGNDFCLPPGPKRDEQLALLRTWIDRAAEMNAPVIRIFAGRVPKGETEGAAVARAIEGIRECLPHAVERGVFLALENHGGITATPDQVLRLVEAIDSPYFGVNLDTGNFRTDDPYADLARIAPYAVNVQVKTEIQDGTSARKKPADLSRLVGILRESRYSGYVVLEYEGAEDPRQAVPRHIEELRKHLG